MLRGLIFDFDGLILDTETPETEAWQQTFAHYDLEFPAEYFQWAVGRGAEQITERPIDFFKRDRPDLDHDQIVLEANQRRLEGIYANPPRLGVVDLIQSARNQGLKLAVASSSRHQWIDSHLAHLGLDHYFDITVGADDVGRAKPFPDLYELALEKLDLDPSHAIALEDSLNGATAAHAASLAVIHVPNQTTAIQQVPFAVARYQEFTDFQLEDLRALFITQSK